MSGKPFQSSLIPYRDEIFALRRQRPPVSYARIAEILREKYGLVIRRAAIGKFVKVRARGRKVYFFKEEPKSIKPSIPKPSQSVAKPLIATTPTSTPNSEPEPSPGFYFPFTEHYNLRRLPPEEAAARRKRLEEREKERK